MSRAEDAVGRYPGEVRLRAVDWTVRRPKLPAERCGLEENEAAGLGGLGTRPRARFVSLAARYTVSGVRGGRQHLFAAREV